MQCFALTSCWSPVPARVANASSAEKGFRQVKDRGHDDVLVVLEDPQAAHVLAPFRQKKKTEKAGAGRQNGAVLTKLPRRFEGRSLLTASPTQTCVKQ